MRIARFFLAALAAMAFLLVVDGILHPTFFPDGPAVPIRHERAEPLALYRILAMFVVSVLLAYVFPIGYRGRTPWAEGLRFGMLMGVLAALPASLDVFAAAEVHFAGLLTGVLWTVVTWGIAGGLVGASYGGSLPRTRG